MTSTPTAMPSAPAGGSPERAEPTPAVLTSVVVDLPRRWAESVLPAELPVMAREIIRRIRADVPEYRRTMDGPYGRSIRAGVEKALIGFMTQFFRTGSLSPESEQFFRDLGRSEAREGRPHDVLQTAYRIGALAAWHRIVMACEREPLPARVVGPLAEAIFGFADRLARLSGEGYAAAESEDQTVAVRQRARLARLIVTQPDVAPEAITETAARLVWTIPERVCVLDVPDAADADFGPYALVDTEQHLVVLPAPLDLELLPPGRITAGCSLPFAEAASSLKWARLAARLRLDGTLPDAGLLACDEHVPMLLLHAEPALVDLLVTRRLGPLLALPPGRRIKFARLLSAWLENGGSQAELAETLATHRQTLHYRVGRLQVMFGAQLQDPAARVEILLALRAVLPSWELDCG
jgi:hypothetical protein